jgi:hypothetical protein
MIVKFSTRTGALTLHGDAAVTLLKAMGHSGTVPGAILEADLPEALELLRRRLAEEAKAPPAPPATGEDDDEQEREPPITLRMRAVPFIDMIETAIRGGSDLMWERG